MLGHTTEILRAEGRHRPGAPTTAWTALLIAALATPAIHGAIMGTWSERPLQIVYSMTKVPLLLVAATVVCLPNFFVVNTLLGLLLYQFVSIQFAWSLRPFIGSPDFATTFFREDSWTNAYVDAVRAMLMAL